MRSRTGCARHDVPLRYRSSRHRDGWIGAVVVPTAVVGVAMLLVPPDVNDAGRILVALFAWLTVSHGVRGWLERGVSPWPRAIAECTLGGFVGVLAYLVGLRVVEQFVKPAFGDAIDGVDGVGVSATTLLVTIGVVIAALATIRLVRTPSVDRLRSATDSWLVRTAHPGVAGDLPALPGGRHRVDGPHHGALHHGVASPNPTERGADATRRTLIRADVTRASNVIAPTWPLTSVVAVNPLGGLEPLGFDRAAEQARRELRARTHLSLNEFRRDHAKGLTTVDDLRWTIESHFFDECSMPPVEIDGRTFSIASIIEADMLHGPDVDVPFAPRTAVERIEGADGAVGDAIDTSIQHSAAHFVTAGSEHSSNRTSFFDHWMNDALDVSALRLRLTSRGVTWLRTLGNDSARTIDAAFALLGVADDERVDEMRGHLARLQGWAGYAKWRTEWAHPDEPRPTLSLIELVAARCALEAACVISEIAETSMPSSSQRACGTGFSSSMPNSMPDGSTR